MSLIARLVPSFLSSTLGSKLTQNLSHFHSLSSPIQKMPSTQTSVNPGGLFSLATRSVIRCHFPRPSERRRVKRHGWQKRISTPLGRRVLMNRILKGRWVYSH